MTDLDGETIITADVPSQSITVQPSVLKARPIQYQQSQTSDPSLPASTTFQQDLTFAGQRRINLIWEYTQAAIAIGVVIVALIAAVVAMMLDKEVSAFLSFVCGNVVGFYFSRTNHAAIGGIGVKPNEEYKGR